MLKKRVIKELSFIVKAGVIFAALAVVSFVVAMSLGKVLAEKEVEIIMNQQELPKAMLELIGMQKLQQFPATVEVFFLMLQICNLIAMGVIMAHSVRSMREISKQGAFSFFYMQIMRKRVYFLIEALKVLCVALIAWGVYMAVMLGASTFIVTEVEVVNSVQLVLSTISIWGSGVVTLMVAFSVCYGLKQSYKMHNADFGLLVMALGFILGNMYKIPQFIGQKQVEQMIPAQKTMELMRTMKEFRFLCPFAWLNPFNIYNNVVEAGVLWSYMGVAVLFFAIAGVVFCVRDWWEV